MRNLEFYKSEQKERKSSIILCRRMRLIWFPGRMQLNFSLKQSRNLSTNNCLNNRKRKVKNILYIR